MTDDAPRQSIKDRIAQYEQSAAPSPNYKVYKPRAPPAVSRKPDSLRSPHSPTTDPAAAATPPTTAPPLPRRPPSKQSSVSSVVSVAPPLPRRPPAAASPTVKYAQVFDRVVDERLFTTSLPPDRLSEAEVSFVWMHSGLPVSHLRQIWTSCDSDRRGTLTKEQFARGLNAIDEELRRRRSMS